MKAKKIKSLSIYIGLGIALIPVIIIQLYPADADSIGRTLQVIVLVVCSLGLPVIVGRVESYLFTKFYDEDT